MRDLINKAKQYAELKHSAQLRKGDKKPYITHLQAVYELASSVTSDPAILASCWLHDTIEDTNTTYSDLIKLFGLEVANIVLACSEDKTIPWEKAKKLYLKTVFANKKAIIVAWADKMHNTADLANVIDYGVFNRPLKDKITFYTEFANKLDNREMYTRLKLLLDIYTI